MKTVSTFDEFLLAFHADNALPSFELPNESDDALASVLMQIHLDILEDSHYIPLAQLMIERSLSMNINISEHPELYSKVVEAKNRLINLAIRLEIRLTEEMIMYYCAKVCEELGIGDMMAGTDNIDDDWFIIVLYKEISIKAKMFNLYGWSKQQELHIIQNQLANLIPQRDMLNIEIGVLVSRKMKLQIELNATGIPTEGTVQG